MSLSGTQQAPLESRFDVARFGATRFGYYAPIPRVTIGGVDATDAVKLETLTWTEEIDSKVDKVKFTMRNAGPNPVSGVGITLDAPKAVTLALGSADNEVFAGTVQRVKVRNKHPEQDPAGREWIIEAHDYKRDLRRMLVTKVYTSTSASAIALDLLTVARDDDGTDANRLFTGNNIESGLPTVDEITFKKTSVDKALDRLAERVDGHWYVDHDGDLHFFTGGESSYAPQSLGRAAGYANEILALGAVAYYRLGESSGPTAVDEVAAANGTYSGGVTYGASGALADGSTAATFDGVDGLVTTAIDEGDLPNTAWSITGWAKTTSGTADVMVSRHNSRPRVRVNSDGEAQVHSFDGSTTKSVTGSAALDDGDWHFVVATYDGTNLALYTDGSADGTPVAANGYDDASNKFFKIAGRDSGANDFDGDLAEVAFFDRALSASEIAHLYSLRESQYAQGSFYADGVYWDLELDWDDTRTVVHGEVEYKGSPIAEQVTVGDTEFDVEEGALFGSVGGGILGHHEFGWVGTSGDTLQNVTWFIDDSTVYEIGEYAAQTVSNTGASPATAYERTSAFRRDRRMVASEASEQAGVLVRDVQITGKYKTRDLQARVGGAVTVNRASSHLDVDDTTEADSGNDRVVTRQQTKWKSQTVIERTVDFGVRPRRDVRTFFGRASDDGVKD